MQHFYNFPSGAYLGCAIAFLMLCTSFGVVVYSKVTARIQSATGVAISSGALGISSFAAVWVDSRQEYAQAAPWWVAAMLAAVAVYALGMLVRRAWSHKWLGALTYAVLLFAAGASFSYSMLLSTGHDGWALANSVCWTATLVSAVWLVVAASRVVRSVRPGPYWLNNA